MSSVSTLTHGSKGKTDLQNVVTFQGAFTLSNERARVVTETTSIRHGLACEGKPLEVIVDQQVECVRLATDWARPVSHQGDVALARNTYLEVDEVGPIVPEPRKVHRPDKVSSDTHPEPIQERRDSQRRYEYRHRCSHNRCLCFSRVHREIQDGQETEELRGTRVQPDRPVAENGEKDSADEEIRERDEGVGEDIGACAILPIEALADEDLTLLEECGDASDGHET